MTRLEDERTARVSTDTRQSVARGDLAARARPTELRFADPAAAIDLIEFLRRLLRYDRAAVVRLVSSGSVIAAYGHPPFDVYAVRTARLAMPTVATAGARARLDTTGRAHPAASQPHTNVSRVARLSGAQPGDEHAVDTTVAAGDLLDAMREDGGCPLPKPVAGPSWAGLLPPRTGWTPAGDLSLAALGAAVARGVAEFRRRAGAVEAEGHAARAALDALAAEIWDRPLDEARHGDLPLRAAHAVHALGFLGPPDGPPVTVARHRRWLRLDARFGTVAMRLGAPRRARLLIT
jgi:hypothetical protein